MIDKLKYKVVDSDNPALATMLPIIDKINELVDAVNNLEANLGRRFRDEDEGRR